MARRSPVIVAPSAMVVVSLIALAGCGSGTTTVTETVRTDTQTTPTATTPTATTGGSGDVAAATAALSGLIDRATKDPSFNSKGFRTDPAVTAALVAKIDRIAAQNKAQGFPGLDFDPFICAQQLPEGKSFSPARVAGNNMTINGRFTYGAGKPVTVTYGMVLQAGAWKLDSTDCVEQALNGG